MRPFVFSIGVVLVTACGSSETARELRPPTSSEVVAGPPTAPTEGSGLHESAFDRIVGDTEMVGLGESIHTSGGYHRVRARLVRHLVEDLGFRAVALETPWADAEPATKFVETCAGSALEASQSIFAVFASIEMKELFSWMCEWNTTHPADKVSFWGYDIQEPWADGALLREFAPDDEHVKALDACLGVAFGTVQEFYASPAGQKVLAYEQAISDEENAACAAAVADARAWLGSTTPSRAVRFASLAVDAIEAYQGEMFYFLTNHVKSFEARDRAMAKTLIAMRELRSPGQRVAVIAHNTHVAHTQDAIKGDYRGAKSMGQFVREDGASFEAIALSGYHVHIDWGQFPDPAVPTAKDAVERILHDLGASTALVDLQQNAVLKPRVEYELQGERMVPGDQFRALLFLDTSEKMTYAR